MPCNTVRLSSVFPPSQFLNFGLCEEMADCKTQAPSRVLWVICLLGCKCFPSQNGANGETGQSS